MKIKAALMICVVCKASFGFIHDSLVAANKYSRTVDALFAAFHKVEYRLRKLDSVNRSGKA